MTDARLVPSDFRSPPMLIAGLGGIGRIPFAAGTWASLATLPVAG